MAYQITKLDKLNEERREFGGEAYKSVEDLLNATRNYIDNFRKLWRDGVDLPLYQVEAAQKHYQELRELLMSMGADIKGLPRRLRIKTERLVAA